jgi:hypothetical protein
MDTPTIAKLIERELGLLSDAQVNAHVRALLVEPRMELRNWDYGDPGQQYPCWIVLDDTTHSNSGIAYCEQGFGPRQPWGLLKMRETAGQPGSMGMDSGWFPAFLDAFFDSFAATRLPIWSVFSIADGALRQALTEQLSWADAWERCEVIRRSDPSSTFAVHHSFGEKSQL